MALVRIGGMGKPRKKASGANANKKPCLAALLTLLGLAAAFRKRSLIVGQKKQIALRERNAGVGFGPVARSTLCRQLAALEHLGYINRICRHYWSPKLGKPVYRKTMFTFGRSAIEFVKQLRRVVSIPIGHLREAEIPLGRLHVPKTGHNQKTYLRLSGLQRAVDKSSGKSQRLQSRPPRGARG